MHNPWPVLDWLASEEISIFLAFSIFYEVDFNRHIIQNNLNMLKMMLFAKYLTKKNGRVS